MALLEIRNIAKHFGAIHAVSDVSFSVEPGEIVGLMGDNGAGKSTMVKLIAGNFPPTHGDVIVDGEACHFNKPMVMPKPPLTLCRSGVVRGNPS